MEAENHDTCVQVGETLAGNRLILRSISSHTGYVTRTYAKSYKDYSLALATAVCFGSAVPRNFHNRRKTSQPACEDTCVLPVLATAEQIAKPLGVTSRTITAWAASRKIPVALRHGKILRFYPRTC